MHSRDPTDRSNSTPFVKYWELIAAKLTEAGGAGVVRRTRRRRASCSPLLGGWKWALTAMRFHAGLAHAAKTRSTWPRHKERN